MLYDNLTSIAARAPASSGLKAEGRLYRYGELAERAGRLGATVDEAGREAIAAAAERLAGPDAMGDLFKVMTVLPKGVSAPPFSSPRRG